MSAASFIADMNALQRELDSLPAEASRLIGTLMEMVELQQESIESLLTVNRKLLDIIDELKG